jgi:hypothetical protein
VRFAQQLGQEVVRDGNRLRSLVLRYYPAALDAFPHLDSLVGLAFLQTYPTLSQAQALSFEQLKVFLRAHHHTQVRSWPTIYAGLHSDQPRSDPALDAAYAPLSQAQARILETLIRSRNACLTSSSCCTRIMRSMTVFPRPARCWLRLYLPSWAMTALGTPLQQFCKPWQGPAR